MSKRRYGFLIILSVLLLLLTCSCGREAEPAETDEITLDTEELPSVITDEITSEITEEDFAVYTETEIPETQDTEPMSSETEAMQTIRPVEITVADAPADCYTEPGSYEICFHSDSEYARDVILTPSTQLKNFKFYIYDIDKYMTDNVCEISEVLYSSDSVSPDRPFVCRIWIPEFISSYGISYEENGKTVMLMFGESGMDGSVLLTSY